MSELEKISIKDKLASKKFVFSIFAMTIVSCLLYFKALPATHYEVVAISIIVGYLSSNVAYKYAAGKTFKNNTVEEVIYEEPIIESKPAKEPPAPKASKFAEQPTGIYKSGTGHPYEHGE